MMKSLFRKTAALALLGGGLAAAQDDATQGLAMGDVASAASTTGWSVVRVPQLKHVWTAQAVLDPRRDRVTYFSNDESIVYMQSSAGTLTAFNAESGREFWSAQIGQVDEVSLQAASNDKVVVVTAGPVLHGYDKFTGAKLFSFRLPEQPRGGPVLTEDSVAVPTGSGFISAYTLESLRHFGRFGELKKGQAMPHDWRYGSGEILRFPPVVGGGRLAFASDSGNVHAVNLSGPNKGQTEFQFLMRKRATAPLTLLTRDDRDFLLAVSADNQLFCIELQTNGSMRWAAPLGRLVTKPVVAVGSDVFVLADDGELSVLDLLTGQPRMVRTGVRGVASRREQHRDEVPTFGAAVEVRLDGSPEFAPFRIANRSTGQGVRSVQLDLTTAAAAESLTFAVDERSRPVIRMVGASDGVVLESVEVSENRKQLTASFAKFAPNSAIEFYADVEHVAKPLRDVEDRELDGTAIRATVVIAGDAAVAARHRVMGELRGQSAPWKIRGVESVAAISPDVVYAIDGGGRLIACLRATARVIESHDVRDYSVHVSNFLTDRVYLGTSSGQIACFAEKRVEIGALPFPAGGGLTWVPYPEADLAPDFGQFHQRPEDQPIMPEVPETTPASSSVTP